MFLRYFCVGLVLSFLTFPAALAQDVAATASLEENQAATLIRGLLRDGLSELAIEQMEEFLQKYPDSTRRGDYLFEQGSILFGRGELERAIPRLTEFTSLSGRLSKKHEARYMLASAHALSGHAETARGLFESLLKAEALPPDIRRDATLRLSKLLQQKGESAKALSLLLGLPEGDLESFEAQRLLGECYFEGRSFSKARNAYTEALAMKPAPEAVELLKSRLGLLAYFEKDYLEAARLLEPLYAKNPEGELAATLAWVYYRLDDFGRAYDTVRAGRTGLGGLDEAGRALLEARSAMLRGDSEGAMALLQKTSEEGDTPPAVLALLGQLEREAGLWKRALAHFRKAANLSEAEEANALWVEVGEILYFDEKDYEGARRVFETLAQSPSAYESLSRLLAAKCALAQGDKGAALDHLNALVQGFEGSELLDEAWFLLGELFLSQDDAKNAKNAYAFLLREYPFSPLYARAVLRKADAEDRLGETGEALESRQFYLSRTPDSPQAPALHLKLGHLLRKRGDFEGARRHFEILREKFVKSPESQNLDYELGRVALDAGRSEEALALFEKDAFTDSSRSFFWKGRVLAKADPKAAQEAWKAAVEADPLSEWSREALWEMAFLAFDEGDDKAAFSALQTLRDAGGLWGARAQATLETEHFSRGQIKEALESIPAFRQSDPLGRVDAEAMLRKALDWESEGKNDRAAEESEKILARFPGTPAALRAHALLCDWHAAGGRFSKAVSHGEAALQGALSPALEARTRYALGGGYFKLKQYAKAAPLFEAAAKSDSLSEVRSELHYLAGVSYEQAGQAPEARRHYLQFIKRTRESSRRLDERVRVALFFQRGGWYEDSMAVCRALLIAGGGDALNAEVQFYLAENYKKFQKPSIALKEYLRVTYLYPNEIMWSVTARFEAAKIYEEQGRFDEAVTLYRKIMEASGGSAQGDTAKERLEKLLSKDAASPGEAGRLNSEEL